MAKLLFAVSAFLLLITVSVIEAGAALIDPELAHALKDAAPDTEFLVIITLADRANIADIKDTDKPRQRTRIITRLKAKSEFSQKSVKAFLVANKAKRIRPFWIVNRVAAAANAAVITKLAAMPGVESITLDATLKAPTTFSVPAEGSWGLAAIGADEMWSLGYTGQGVVVATLDTGVDGTHPDLESRWRGGSNSWFDPHGRYSTPFDRSGHGTQVMGVVLGSNIDGNATGVAPDAQWIAAKLFDDADNATYSDIHECFQWVLDPDGNPNTDDAPDIVNNSWGFSDSADECINDFEEDVQALRSAGIAVVFAAGNSGPYRSTSVSPANYAISFSVGSVNQGLAIDHSSSRGPSACDGKIYPKIVAPGASVRTCDLYGGYAYVSGTSFAAPHIAGAFALLRSAFPALPADRLEWALQSSCLDLGSTGPDNVYGNGFVDVAAAYSLLLTLPQNIPPAAADDNSVTTAGKPVAIDVLANDSDPDSAIDPATVMVTAEPAGGTTTVNPLSGAITYTPAAGFGGSDSFTYTVADTNGDVSNTATVMITVNDVITVTRARFYRQSQTWKIIGTAGIFGPDNSITIHLGSTLAGPVLATVNVSPVGDWSYIQPDSPIAPDADRRISLESAAGASCLNSHILILRRQ